MVRKKVSKKSKARSTKKPARKTVRRPSRKTAAKSGAKATKKAAESEKILTRNATPGAGGTRIDRDKYESMRKALLKVIPKTKTGIAFGDLAGKVKPHLSGRAFPEGVSIPWYTVVVKLDIEARGLIERVPGEKPQRVRRK